MCPINGYKKKNENYHYLCPEVADWLFDEAVMLHSLFMTWK